METQSFSSPCTELSVCYFTAVNLYWIICVLVYCFNSVAKALPRRYGRTSWKLIEFPLNEAVAIERCSQSDGCAFECLWTLPTYLHAYSGLACTCTARGEVEEDDMFPVERMLMRQKAISGESVYWISRTLMTAGITKSVKHDRLSLPGAWLSIYIYIFNSL